MPLVMEFHDGRRWRHLTALTAESAEGSISAARPSGTRDMILFRCDGDRSVIRRSTGGYDWEDGLTTVIVPVGGFEEVTVLTAGECYELTASTGRGVPYTVRWRHED
jgi:hypothetical protein